MKPTVERLLDRRSFFRSTAKTGAAIAAGSLILDSDLEAAMQSVNTMSRPSELKITDMRVATVKDAPMRCPILKLYTNQGLVGLGEVRDGAHKDYALSLKSRILGENPCNVDMIFRNRPYRSAPRQVRDDRRPRPAQVGALQQVRLEVAVLEVVERRVDDVRVVL